MPWVSIIMFLISFLASKSSGKSTGQAAAIGAAAGLATYYVADPANKDNLLGLTWGDSADSAKVQAGAPTETNSSSIPATLGTVGKTVITEASGVLKSWGPTGTLAVAAGTTALATDGSKYLPWIIGGVALLFLLK